MPLWDKSGTKPKYLPTEESRRCIATNDGWVLRRNFTDVHSNARTKDEILVSIGNLGDSSDMGQPSVSTMWLANTSGGTDIKNGLVNYLYVGFDEPVAFANGSAVFTIAVANTVSGNAVNAASNNNIASVTQANNTLVFAFTPGAVGTYKVQAQNIGNTTAATPYSLNTGGEIANLTISAAVSNALSTFSVIA